MNRNKGVLCHVSSFPNRFGIGDFGPFAYQFIDILSAAAVTHWQVLPLNPTDPLCGNSPYSSISTFAGNRLFISPEMLVADGLLTQNDLVAYQTEKTDAVHYAQAATIKTNLFNKLYSNFNIETEEFRQFVEENNYWLDDFALYAVIKSKHNGKAWPKWDHDYRDRTNAARAAVKKDKKDELTAIKCEQYLFFKQWQALKEYASAKGIQIVGDLPIYVDLDSADVWANREIFKITSDGNAQCLSGVPPDYFSEEGQLWGHPVYNWRKLEEDGFDWWLSRVKQAFDLFDLVRIDHFRGLVQYWEIPAKEQSAINGRWVDVPTNALLQKIQSVFGRLPIIAEDLGIMGDDVRSIMQQYGLPGMKVLQFAFDGGAEHPYLPYNYPRNCVVYTGTHDNNTTRGWFRQDISSEEKKSLFAYCGGAIAEEDIAPAMMDLALKSCADLVIIPVQDILNLDEHARFNTPGTKEGNWLWCMKDFKELRGHIT